MSPDQSQDENNQRDMKTDMNLPSNLQIRGIFWIQESPDRTSPAARHIAGMFLNVPMGADKNDIQIVLDSPIRATPLEDYVVIGEMAPFSHRVQFSAKALPIDVDPFNGVTRFQVLKFAPINEAAASCEESKSEVDNGHVS